MADNAARIEQFRKMAEADPGNELGHFSLGRALLDAKDYPGAIASFRRVIEINPNISKVYQLLGTALLQQGQREQAVETLRTGAKIANERGDLMPKNDMLRMLKDLGVEMPELQGKQVEREAGAGEVLCRRCGQVGRKLEKPPFRGDFGQQIYDNICTACWKEAIGMGTKVINELRLPLADPQAQRIWDQHIREFLNLA